MSTQLEILEELESHFLLNKQNNEILQETLITLDEYNWFIEYISYWTLMRSIKMPILKQKIENENFRIGWIETTFVYADKFFIWET